MGTWRWFSVEHCTVSSSCVVVDAWLQLFLCVSALLLFLLLSLGCYLGTRYHRGIHSSSGPSSEPQFWTMTSIPATTRGLSLLSFFRWGKMNRSSSKTAPMPHAVIQKDADEAHITSHKNSLKQASEFMRQTQRISRTDFATKDKDARVSDGRNLSFIGRIGSFTMRRNSKNMAKQEEPEQRRASHDSSMTSGVHSDKLPLRKLSNPLPRNSTSRRGSVTTSSLEMDAVLNAAAGFTKENTHRLTKTQSSSGRVERSSSFRKRFTHALVPHFMRAIQSPLSTPTNTGEQPKKSHRERSATTFEVPSYRKRQKLAALPLEHRKNKERRGSVELRTKRRLSVGREAQIHFEVSDGNEASVYEVKLNEITLVKRLAFGPLSEVYAAIWRDTKVGVKLLMPREGVTDKLEEAVKNFRREIWIMNALRHPNIVKLIGASLTPTCYVLVMEYMSNGSLYEYLRDEANFFPQQMVLTTALDIADGMRHIHACNVLQRDLKSKNCLVSENLVVKVADFGLSRFVTRTPGEQYTFVGTPFWAAPEVIRHEPYDEKADVYSFAIVLWELVERKDPYEHVNPFQVPLQVANEGLRPDEFSHPAPLGLEQLMKQCWDANPDQRPSFDDITETLQKWLTPTTDDPEKEREGDDLSAHVQRERHCATQRELNRFASSHNANAKAIPIVLSRGKTDREVHSLHQRRSSAVAMHAIVSQRPHSDRSISRVSNHSAP